MLKNTASQKIALFAFDTSTGAPKTGDAGQLTAYVNKDYAGATVLGDTTATEISATNAPGWYIFDLTQAETNADALLFSGKSSTGSVTVVGQLVFTRPANFTALAIDSSGNVKIQTVMKKNQARANYPFLMTDSTNHNPATGKAVTVTRVLDSGSFGAGTIGSVTEIAYGLYRVDLPAADLNADVVTLRMTASGCDDLQVTLLMEP